MGDAETGGSVQGRHEADRTVVVDVSVVDRVRSDQEQPTHTQGGDGLGDIVVDRVGVDDAPLYWS